MIYGLVWNDLDRDGVQDAGEPPLARAEVRLKDASHVLLGFWKTQADGAYTFANLSPGDYLVSEKDPYGYGSSTINEIGVHLGPNQSLAVNFGDYALPTVTPTPTATTTPTPTATPALPWRAYLPLLMARGR
jgi:hypothetical protein